MKPKLKPFVEYYVDKEKISFFARPGIAIEIDDEEGYIHSACQLMDGKNNLHFIKSKLEQSHPQLDNSLDELINLLDSEGLIEDADLSNSNHLTEYDKERWSRNIEFFGAYCKLSENKFHHQETIKNTKVTLLGLGGVGSNVLLNLVALGVRNIKIIDFDNVELSNLNRQVIYNEDELGQPKTKIAKNKILAFYKDANIEAINTKISSSSDIEQLIDGQDFVINAADQPRAQIIDWVNAACIKKKIPFICGALDYKYAICYSVIPKVSGCIECWKSSARQSNAIFQDYYSQKGFHPSPSLNVTIMPFISIVGGLIGSEFIKIITGITPPSSLGKLRAYDFTTGEISIVEHWEKQPDCLVCSDSTNGR